METTQQVVCPKMTDAQIQAQIENMRWQEQQQALAATWSRQNTELQQARDYHEYMIDHVATPMASLGAILIVTLAAVYLLRREIQAGVEKNHDDNQSDVRRAQEILDEERERKS